MIQAEDFRGSLSAIVESSGAAARVAVGASSQPAETRRSGSGLLMLALVQGRDCHGLLRRRNGSMCVRQPLTVGVRIGKLSGLYEERSEPQAQNYGGCQPV